MDYTGERLVPGKQGLELLELEHRARYELVARMASNKDVLDLGSGSGYGAARLAATAESVVAVEMDEEAVEFSRSMYPRPNLQFVVDDVLAEGVVERLQRLRPDGYGLVTCFELIEHLERPDRLLRHIAELLSSDGLAFISTPNVQRDQAVDERDNPFHVVEFSRQQFSDLVRQFFPQVRLLEQEIYLASRISKEGVDPHTVVHWPADTTPEVKYFLAVCSHQHLATLDETGLTMMTGEKHLVLLRDRIGELRKDRTIRGERIEALREQGQLLRSRVTELEDSISTKAAAEAEEAQNQQALQDTLAEVRAELERLRDENATAMQQRLGLEEELILAANRCRDLEEELALRDERIAQLREQIAERETAFGPLGSRLIEALRDLEARRAECRDLRETLKQETERAAEAGRQSERNLDRARRATEQARQAEARAQLADVRSEEAMRRVKELTRTREALEQRLEEVTEGTVDQLAPIPTSTPGDERFAPDPLVPRLAAELHHLLTSRRWRFAMLFVKLRNALFRRTESDPQHAHLFSIFRMADRKIPDALISPMHHGLNSTYLRLVSRPPHVGDSMQLLSKKKRSKWKKWLAKRPQAEKVTVIMPTWNRAGLLPDAIRSVVGQSYTNWELLVVDDGSDDETEAVVAGWIANDSRIRYLRIEHQGVSAARDHGLGQASGNVIAYLDSDNVWDPDHLLFLVHALADSGRATAYSALRIVDHDHGDAVSYRRRLYSRRALLRNNYIDINIFVHRIELYRELGGFDRDLRRWVDWDLILRYTKEHPPAQVPVALCDYRRCEDFQQITTAEPQAFKHKVLNKHLIAWNHLEKEACDRLPGHATIVVLNYRLPDFTRRCVESILGNTRYPHYDILIVDNGSLDRSRRELREVARSDRRVSYMENYENHGFSLGNNLGAARSTGEFVVWLNNDIEVHDNWLIHLLTPLIEDPSVGMVGPKMLYPDDTLQQGGLAFCRLSKIPYHLYQDEPGDAPHVNKSRTFQCLNGACLALRAVDFIRLRGLDPLYLNGCEDLDFSFRMRFRLGKRLLYNPASSLTHYAGKSPGRSKNIMYNRSLFVDTWRDEIEVDDTRYFTEDGFVAVDYVKKGRERDGELAAYYPVLKSAHVMENTATSSSSLKDAPVRNVGLVSIWYERGVSYVAKTLADALDSSGAYRTHVYARWESENFHNSGTIYHPRVRNAGNDPPASDIVEWAEQSKLDLVVFVEVHPNDWKRVAALQTSGRPVIGYEHLDVLRIDMLERYRKLDGLMSSTFHGWRELKKTFPESICLLVPWGIREENTLRAASSSKPTEDDLSFVHVAGWGGLDNRKNTDLLIRAFNEARLPNAHLTIYTQAPLEKYGQDCVKIVGTNPRIHIQQGTFEDIFVAYQGADMLLWPSKREGLGLPILEALSCGLPVLISDGWMMKEWPILGEHAVVCPARANTGNEKVPRYLPTLEVDATALVDRLRQLSQEPSRIRRMAKAVLRDREQWIWSWQSEALRQQITWFLKGAPGDRDESRFLPESILRFEESRRQARRMERLPVPAPDSAPRENGSQNGRSSVVQKLLPPYDVSSFLPSLPVFHFVLQSLLGSSDKNHLFICGCPRSGTTALVRLLNADPRFVIGHERYKKCPKKISPRYFKLERFFDLRPEETNFRDQDFYAPLRHRWQTEELEYVGDKFPFYYKHLQRLSRRFPGARFLFLIRDLERVASSYNVRASNPKDHVWTHSMDYRVAVDHWNDSLRCALEYLRSRRGSRLFVIHYESFFRGDLAYLEALYNFLELPLLNEVRSKFKTTTASWEERWNKPLHLTPAMLDYVQQHRHTILEEKVLTYVPRPILR